MQRVPFEGWETVEVLLRVSEVCVKPSWCHCQSCGPCALRDQPRGNSPGLEVCFNCGSLKHKRRACPLKDKQRPSNNKTKGGRILPKQQPKKSNSKRQSGAQRRINKLETAE
ncbi:rRNA N6-adenosine-methyltransferase ZCCHC4-like [Salmo trutta]|uniref:rRNA N6-adenosine-methyltransferase ZCCHC4-like n=1 Tax=Salmo trutta TaxID=8032 RepID=UPI00113281B5|nr:rRNA N6-adenosine-methyltransferase ZCCHC4-like [Salmo trutta]XP_029615700.1 rRNA N6-adenosine-methyltransferase ZCCHC4-like [Salmo trutta]